MEDAIIALVLIVISLLSWIFQKGGLLDKWRGATPASDETEVQADEVDEQERARRFMEALGLPQSEQMPPRPVERRAAGDEMPPPLPGMRPVGEDEIGQPAPQSESRPASRPAPRPAPAQREQPADSSDFSWDAPQREEFSWQGRATPEGMRESAGPSQPPQERLSREEREALARIESGGGLQRPSSSSSGAYAIHKDRESQLKQLLFSDRQSLQKAILAQEVLGQPRGLQEFPGPVTVHTS